MQRLDYGSGLPFQTVYIDTGDGEDDGERCCLTNPACFWIFTVLLLTWLFRIIYKLCTRRVKFTYLKIVDIGHVDIDETGDIE